MIERLIKSGWQGIGQPISRRMSFLSPGWWILMLVVVVVGGRILWVKVKNQQRDEIAIAFGRASLPSGVPQVSHDGQKFTFVQVGDHGLGVFLHDQATGQNQLIHQKGAKQDIFLNFAVWPWSPDDRFFAYSAEDLAVCDADTGKEQAHFSTDGNSNVARLLWLSPNRLVYVNRQGFLRIIQNHNGQWRQMPVYTDNKIGVKGLTVLSKDTIAWQRGNRIWTLNLDSNVASVLFDLKTGQLNDFSFAEETGQLLFSSSGNDGDTLWRMPVGTSATSNLVKLASGTSIHDVAWLRGSNGACAFLSQNPHQPEQNFLMIKPDFITDPVPLSGRENVSAFTPTLDGRQLLLTGTISNELAAGIWKYDIAVKTLEPVVSCTDQPSTYAKNVEPLHGVLNLPGRSLDYYVYPPADLNRHSHKKYPVIIGNTLYHALDPVYQNHVQGPLWAPALARCGAYVVIVERPGFWFNGIDQWPENVMDVYKTLAQDPTVDLHQVFLFATSAETPYLNELVEKEPGLWAGLMQFNGVVSDLNTFLPGKPVPRIMVTAGEYEGNESCLKQFQKEANQCGVAVDVVIHPDSTHVLMGKEPLTQKTRAIARFIFAE